MKDLELIPSQSQPLAVIETPKTVTELRVLAIQMGAKPEILKELMDLEDRQLAREKKDAFWANLAGFQTDVKTVLRTVEGAKAKYAPLDLIRELVRPYLEKYGFTYRFTQGDASAPNQRRAVCIITRDGHSEETWREARIDETIGGSGKPIMPAPQQDAAAMSSAQRNAFCDAFGILTAKSDVAGQQAAFKVTLGSLTAERKQAATSPQPAQAVNPPTDSPDTRQTARAILWTTLKSVRGTEQSWHTAQRYITDELGIETLVDKMTLAELQEATRKAKSKLTP